MLARRRLAAKLICELVYQNEANQSKICEMCDFSPVMGIVNINQQIPFRLIPMIHSVLDLLRDPKQAL